MATIPYSGFACDPAALTYYSLLRCRATTELTEVCNERRTLVATIPTAQWDTLKDMVKAHFNERLQKMNIKLGRWKTHTLLDKLLGKELTLLLLGLQGATPTEAERVVANWQGLRPEERWWLVTQIYSVGHPTLNPNRGWYKGIMIALREN